MSGSKPLLTAGRISKIIFDMCQHTKFSFKFFSNDFVIKRAFSEKRKEMERHCPQISRGQIQTRMKFGYEFRAKCLSSRKYYLREIYSSPETFLLPFIILYIIIPCHKLKLKRQGKGKLISFLKSSTMLLITSEYN